MQGFQEQERLGSSNEVIQIVVLGDARVGKTTTISKICHKTSKITPTTPIQFSAVTMPVGQSEYLLKFWDTSGQQKYRNIAITYLLKSVAAILVYDVTNYQSFHNVKEWINEMEQRDCNIPIIIYGNKIDKCINYKNNQIEKVLKKVSYQEAAQLAQLHNAIFCEGCGLTDQNLTRAIEKLIIQRFRSMEIILEDHETHNQCCC